MTHPGLSQLLLSLELYCRALIYCFCCDAEVLQALFPASCFLFHFTVFHSLAPHLTLLLYGSRTATRVPTRVFYDRVDFNSPLPLPASLTLLKSSSLRLQAL